MKSVSGFEASLLRILRCFLRRHPLEQALPLMFREHPPPRCLSRACVELARETLARGSTLLLARRGWRRERFLRDGRGVDGRLWQRTPPGRLGLAFSRNSLQWLIWITSVNVAQPSRPPDIDAESLTAGDRLLLFFAFETLHETLAAAALLRQPPFAGHGLVWLAFPDLIAANNIARPPDVESWTGPESAWLLEALQPLLAERCWSVELHKRQIVDPRRMAALGRAQQQALEALFNAADSAGRRDLVRFVLKAAARLLDGAADARQWFARLDTAELRLADRTQVYHSALVLLRQLDRLRDWERGARTIGYHDEGYAAGQLWKSDWERFDGEALCRRAAGVLRQFEPLAKPPAGGEAIPTGTCTAERESAR